MVYTPPQPPPERNAQPVFADNRKGQGRRAMKTLHVYRLTGTRPNALDYAARDADPSPQSPGNTCNRRPGANQVISAAIARSEQVSRGCCRRGAILRQRVLRFSNTMQHAKLSL